MFRDILAWLNKSKTAGYFMFLLANLKKGPMIELRACIESV